MSNSARIFGAASNTLTTPLNIEDVFSTYLYEGTTGSQTHDNGIDLSTEGGLVWLKNRDASSSNRLIDSERGISKVIYSDATNLEATESNTITAFNTNGFSTGGYLGAYSFASWTFRKAPKFFDVVTYTGTGSARTVSHNLGSVPATIIIKRTDSTTSWNVYHRGLNGGTNPEQYGINLNTTGAEFSSSGYWNNTAPTSTEFTVGTSGNANASGGSYVAYLFAHNDGDGGFGPDGDQDIIKCGSYTGNGSGTGPEIDLGFEPQWVIIKRADSGGGWLVIDTMRGWTNSDDTWPLDDPFLRADDSQQEYGNSYTKPLATGFQLTTTSSAFNTSGGTYIYMAIRRGPMAVPESGTEVFNTILRTGTSAAASVTGVGFSPDLIITGARNTNRTHGLFTRLHGATRYQISTGQTGEYSNTTTLTSFDMDGYSVGSDTGATAINTSDNLVSWNFKRTPNFYDTVVYTGTGSATTVSHNLGIAPELMIIKGRSTSFDRRWIVYTGTANKYMRLDQTDSLITDGTVFNNTSPSATSFTVGTSGNTNASGETYIAHLFGTLSGISKVGSISHTNGVDTNVDCGFSSGARFVLWKRSDAANSWGVVDVERGLVSGNDALLLLNATDAETSSYDLIDPLSSGFVFTGVFDTGTYIFFAIA